MNEPIEIKLSNHHVHMTRDICDKLFGEGYELTLKNYLTKRIYACYETITVVGPKGEIQNVRVLGPLREYTQVELLRGDCFKLGVTAPVRDSGNLENAAVLRLIGPKGEVELACGIIALRHIHMGKPMTEKLGVKDKDFVRVQIGGERGLVFNNVLIRTFGGDASVMHVDSEEGNACGISNNAVGEIILEAHG